MISQVQQTYIHYTIFLLISLLYFWAGRLAPNFHVGNTRGLKLVRVFTDLWGPMLRLSKAQENENDNQYCFFQSRPGSHLKWPHLSSAGGRRGPPCHIGTQEVGTYVQT
jgi:hypothetical protein